MSTRVFILKKITTQHALIEDHMRINFGEKNSAKMMEAATYFPFEKTCKYNIITDLMFRKKRVTGGRLV